MTRKKRSLKTAAPASLGGDSVRLTPRQTVFTVLFLVVAVGGSFALAGGKSGLAASYLFLLFPLAAVVATIVRARRPARGRILFLRKFHTERPPNFPVSRLMSSLDGYGYEVVTLADTLVGKSPDRPFMIILCWVIACCVVMVGTFLPIFAFVAVRIVTAMVLTIVTLGMINPMVSDLLVMLSTITATGAATVFWGRTLHPWRRVARSDLVEKAAAFFLKYAPGGFKDLSKLDGPQFERVVRKPIRRFFDTGLVVVRCSDENWRCAVEHLVRSSVAICIDISNPSDHIRTEVALIAAHAARRVIWLRQEGTPSPFLNGPSGSYSIYQHIFGGARFDFPYPADPGGNLHGLTAGARIAISQHTERLLPFLQAISTATQPTT